MDYILLENLRISAAHGHYARERRVEQEFEISLEVGFDTQKAGASDKLADSLDYGKLRKLVQDIFAGKKRYLLEALAADIAGRILEDERALEVTVTIRKVAVWPDCVPGVRITRGRK